MAGTPNRDAARLVFIQSLRQYHLSQLNDPHALLNLQGIGTSSLAGWFLGPKAENKEVFQRMVDTAIEEHCRSRQEYFPTDPGYVTEEIKKTPEYQTTIAHFEHHLKSLLHELRGSVPFWSYRWQSHMNWDLSMPSLVGYFAAMLYNPNNVAAEASPVTTMLEMEVGDDLCRMLGYSVPPRTDSTSSRPWGHITCDGSVANLESIWAARNLKLFPVTVAAALKKVPALAAARSITVALPTGGSGILIELSNWQILNLRIDDVLDLSPRLTSEYGIPLSTVTQALSGYSVQNLGIEELWRTWLPGIAVPIAFGPATMHYSWPKGAAIAGIGANNMIAVQVDGRARMSISHIRTLLEGALKRQQPVLMVIAVIGSTEESAVDPLADIIRLREELRLKGLEFEIHADGAWGGYFASILRPDPHATAQDHAMQARKKQAPTMSMSPYVMTQYKALGNADSITVDPHKAGYTPYPAGGLCYRNGSMRNLVSFTAPIVYHGGMDPTVGVYGVEGSKPGAAAAGVYLSHRVIRTDQSGYGKILGECFWSSKRLYAAMITMANQHDDFIIVPFQQLPAAEHGDLPPVVHAQYEFVRTQIVPKSDDELLADTKAMELFRNLGSDQIIIAYAFNFKNTDGTVNRNLSRANDLNNAVFNALSLQTFDPGTIPTIPMFVTSSSFDPATYGQPFVDAFGSRLGVDVTQGTAITFLVSTTMDPWITNTAHGSFIPKLVEVMRDTVVTAIQKFRTTNP
jgi:glutamate/tyrosine decarboxylase-like PLP-dependent enzyme